MPNPSYFSLVMLEQVVPARDFPADAGSIISGLFLVTLEEVVPARNLPGSGRSIIQWFPGNPNEYHEPAPHHSTDITRRPKGEGRGLFCNSCSNKLSLTVTVTVISRVRNLDRLSSSLGIKNIPGNFDRLPGYQAWSTSSPESWSVIRHPRQDRLTVRVTVTDNLLRRSGVKFYIYSWSVANLRQGKTQTQTQTQTHTQIYPWSAANLRQANGWRNKDSERECDHTYTKLTFCFSLCIETAGKTFCS